MGAELWQWWAHSDAGLATRIALGAAVFAGLALWELRRRGRQARRWREYLFLLTAVAGAMAYGTLNDQLTVTISWEYFLYGKELVNVLGGDAPPAEGPLRWEAAKIGMKATWTAGLLLGAAMLTANSIPKKIPPLPLRQLYGLLAAALLPTVCLAALGGLAGRLGWLTALGGFREMAAAELWRPTRFMCVWGIHLGGYVGGLVGAVTATVRIVRRRRGTAGNGPSDNKG